MMPLASLLAAVLATSPELAAKAVEWEAPLGCPGADWLTRRIEAYLGRPLSAADLEHVVDRRFGGRVRSADGGFELALKVGEGATQRHRVADHDCEHLAEVAASLLAIAIDPLALGGPVVPLEHSEPPIPVPRPEPPIELANPVEVEPPREPELEPEPELWQLVAVSDEPPRDRPQRGETRLRGLFLANAGLALNVFPNPAPQVHAGVGFDRHDADARVGWRIELAAGSALGGRFRASDGRELGGDLIAWDVALRPCVVPRWGLVDLRACASGGAGQLRGRGVGVQNPQPVGQPWVWGGADVGVAVALRRRDARPRVQAALFVDVGAGINAVRPNFVVLDSSGGAAVSYVMPLVSGRGRLGIELGFF